MQNDAETEKILLQWQVHPLRREPKRLPVLLLTFALGAMCVWLMFGTLVPAIAALLLMTGAVSEYLFPTRYRLTAKGAAAEGGAGNLKITWQYTLRVVSLRNGILLSPLPAPSRLDAFRGILMRCAPDGEPGCRAEILAVAAQYACNITGAQEIISETRETKQEKPA